MRVEEKVLNPLICNLVFAYIIYSKRCFKSDSYEQTQEEPTRYDVCSICKYSLVVLAWTTLSEGALKQ